LSVLVCPSTFEYHISASFFESHKDARNPTFATHKYLIGDNSHTSYFSLNKMDPEKICCDKAEEVENLYDYAPFTRHVLRRHNTKHKMQHSNGTVKGSSPQDHVYGLTLADAPACTPASTAHAHTTVRPDIYLHQRGQLPLPGEPQQEYEKNVSTRNMKYLTEYQQFHSYPAFIRQADLHHSTTLPKSKVDLIPHNQELSQGSISGSYVLAGIRGQFDR
jgi:hypothetical protein